MQIFFDACPPFQIDGNFGATSGIAEMLLQSHEGFIRLLPALPDLWEEGYIKGLCARGGFEIDIYWDDNKLVKANLTSNSGEVCSIKILDEVKVLNRNKEIELNREKQSDGSYLIRFLTKENETYSILPQIN